MVVLQDTAATIAVAVALGADAFSVALGMGFSGVGRRFKARFVTIVALMHVGMPLIGMELGLAAGRLFGTWSAWIGALVLAYIGYEMVRNGRKDTRGLRFQEARKALFIPRASEDGGNMSWPASGILGLSVSVDALTAGFSLGTAGISTAFTVAVMGVTAGLMTASGFVGGQFLGSAVGKGAQVVGGGILFLLAVKMVLW